MTKQHPLSCGEGQGRALGRGPGRKERRPRRGRWGMDERKAEGSDIEAKGLRTL